MIIHVTIFHLERVKSLNAASLPSAGIIDALEIPNSKESRCQGKLGIYVATRADRGFSMSIHVFAMLMHIPSWQNSSPYESNDLSCWDGRN